MARKQYGTTWWGQKWLDSLSGIDNANRIPRGLSYARNDSVFGLKIDTDKGVINAHVVGKYCPYYKVNLKFYRVTEAQSKAFIEAAAKDLAVISGLANRTLAPRLFDIAQEQGIKLFPESWHDIKMSCTCPDYAVPCKHIAAVIYVVSEFIDTNPAMYFKLLGIDIMTAFESKQIFSSSTSEELETPQIATLFRESLLLPKDLLSKAKDYDFDLNLNPISNNDAQVLYLAPNLISYEEDQNLVDRESLKHLSTIKALEEQIEDKSKLLAERSKIAENCTKLALQKKEEFEDLKASCGTIPSKGRPSARTKAILQLIADTKEEYDDLESKRQSADALIIATQKEQTTLKAKLSQAQKSYAAFLENYQNKTAQLLKLGYDPDLLENNFTQESAKDEPGVIEAKIAPLNDIDAGDDEAQLSDEVALDEKGGQVDVRRYQGSLSSLEALTYQTIPDMGDSILSLYGRTCAGFTQGNLRDFLAKTLDNAVSLANAQLRDVVEREFYPFAEDKLSSKAAKAFKQYQTAQQKPTANFSTDPLCEHGFFAHKPLFFMSTKGLLEPTLPLNIIVKNRSGSVLSNLSLFPPLEEEKKALTTVLTEVLKDKKLTNRHIEEFYLSGLFNMFSGFIKNTNMLSNANAETNILYCLWFIATNLVKSRAIAPRLVVNYEGDLQIYWYPATCSEEIESLVTYVGLALQGYEHFLFNRLDRQYYLEPKFLGEMVLVPFIQSYMAWAFQKESQTNQEIVDLQVIFNGRPIFVDAGNDLDEKNLRLRLEGYFSLASVQHTNFTPVLRFTDLLNPENYEGTIFEHLQSEIQEQAAENSQHMKKLLESYAQDTGDKLTLEMLSKFEKGEDSEYQNFSAESAGIGIEFGLMDLKEDIKAELEELHETSVMDETGFVSLYHVVGSDAFNSIRQECLKLLSRLASLAPSLEALYTGKLNVAILPLSEVYQAIREAQNILRLMGVRLVLPKSLTKLLLPLASMRMSKKSDYYDTESFFNFTDMIDFNWSIAIGDQPISKQEFNVLLANAGNVVRFKDSFVYADPELLDKLKKRFDQLQNIKLGQDQILSALLTGSYEDCEVVCSENLRETMDKLMQEDKCELPEGLQATLRPYQVRGYEWLLRNARIRIGSILADDMGLGKTVQVIATILKLKEMGKITYDKPALVIVPTSLLTNWTREVAQFAPSLKVVTYYGAKEYAFGQSDIILTSYGTARSRIKTLNEQEYSLVVIDEAQAIKSMSTALSKSLRTIKSDLFIAMSGTPVENRLLEYFSILDFVNRGLFGSAKSFKDHFATPIERNHDMEAVDRFKKLTAPFIMRRLKSDKNILSDLPEKITSDQFCELSPTQASLYQAMVNKMMEEIEGADGNGFKRSNLILTMIQGLKAICNSPAQFMPNKGYDPADSGKVARLMELLEEIVESKGKVLVFTQSVIMGKMLQDLIETQFARRPSFIYGGISRNERSDMVDAFQNDPSERIMLLSLRAAGTGLNLTAANYVIHFDLWWNPAVENQATDRAHRIGQKKNVQVYRFICSNTFEEKINELLKNKKDLAEVAVSTGESWIGNMSDGELDNLFALHEE